MKDYMIGEKKFTQAPLVPLTIIQILDLLDALGIDNVDMKSMTVWQVIKLLGRNIHTFMSIILESADGMKAEEVADFMKSNLTLPQMQEVLADFFTLNGIEQLIAMFNQPQKK